jgi:hypothetical protein
MKTVVLVGITLLLGACGPAFTVAPDDAGDGEGGVLLRVEPTNDAARPFVSGDASDAGEIRQGPTDAGAGDALDLVEAAAADVDARALVDDAPSSEVPDAHDAGDVPDAHAVDAGGPPPPPALCCATPCSGSQVAAIACSGTMPWTCGVGACTGNACSVGAACHWMGAACTGTVEVCP